MQESAALHGMPAAAGVHLQHNHAPHAVVQRAVMAHLGFTPHCLSALRVKINGFTTCTSRTSWVLICSHKQLSCPAHDCTAHGCTVVPSTSACRVCSKCHIPWDALCLPWDSSQRPHTTGSTPTPRPQCRHIGVGHECIHWMMDLPAWHSLGHAQQFDLFQIKLLDDSK